MVSLQGEIFSLVLLASTMEQLVLIPRYLVEQMLTIGKQFEASLASLPPNAMPIFTKLDDTLKKIIGEFFLQILKVCSSDRAVKIPCRNPREINQRLSSAKVYKNE